MKIKFLGAHNSETHNHRLVSLLIDDFLAIDAGSLTSELTYLQQSRIQAILLTHGHYDHIRAVPAFAFNNTTRQIELYALPNTLQILKDNFMNGEVYPDFTSDRSYLGRSVLNSIAIQSGRPFQINGYRVLPVSVNHPLPSVGFEITDPNGKRLFSSGDTGPGLAEAWKQVSPDLILIDMTFPDKLESAAVDSGHLCPKLLKKELLDFKQIRGYLPEVTAFHLSPQFEKDIQYQLEQVSAELDISIGIAHEGEVKLLN